MKLEEAAIDFLGYFLWVFQNLCDSGLSDTILSGAETNTFPWCTRCSLQLPSFRRHLGWLSWGWGSIQARDRGEEIGNYNGKSKCSTALEFGRKRNMTLELIIRMVVISLRDWGGTMPHSIQCMGQSGYLSNACWLNISTTMCTFGESSDWYSGFCVEWPDGIIREANADWWVNYGEMISVK